jgi:hypothetical protein
MKLTDEQKKELAEIISDYDEVCWWKYAPLRAKSEALNMGEKPPTQVLITEEMLLSRIVGIVEVQPNE